MDSRERRATGVRRVSLETLVEICGMEGAAPAFEAESLDVSGRGMQVRTAYLPDEGAPLVCRFEDRGREVVVEGVVAWRRELARGGEFGIKFTALDAGSVDVLRELCTAADPEQAAEAQAETDADTTGLRITELTRVGEQVDDDLGDAIRIDLRQGLQEIDAA